MQAVIPRRPLSSLSAAITSERARAGFEFGLDICALVFLPILVLVARGVAPLGAVAGLCALGLAMPDGRAAWRRVRGLAVLFGLLVAWGMLSSLWAIQPERSLAIGLRLLGLFAAGLALIAAAPEIAAPRRLMGCLIAGFILALGLTMVQFLTQGALTAPLSERDFIDPILNYAEDGFGLLLLPLCAALLALGRRLAAGVLAVVTAVMVCVLVGDIARIAFISGLAAAALLYFRRRRIAKIAAAASVIVVLTAPLIFPPLAGIAPVRHAAQSLKFSAWHRLEIWSFVGPHIAEKPLLGWGLDSSRAIPGGAALTPENRAWLPLHPHNSPLQFWLELGLPGALWFALFAARLWLALGATPWPRLYAATAGGSLVTALIVGLGSYGAWQEWWVATEFLTLFLILVLARIAAQPMAKTRTGSIP